jgi:hypothetical protein
MAFPGQVKSDCEKAEGRGQRAEVKRTTGFLLPPVSCPLPQTDDCCVGIDNEP